MLGGGFTVGEPGAERREPFRTRAFGVHEQYGCGAVVHSRRVAGGDGGPVAERTAERGELRERRVRARLLVASHR